MFTSNDLVSSYTRADAIEDGELVDVSTTAREAGIAFPVAVSRAAWDRYIDRTEQAGQSASGRLWDALWLLRAAARRADGGDLQFRVYFAMPKDDAWHDHERAPEPGSGLHRSTHRLVTLRALCGPGDNAEPVITIMLPNED